MLARKTQRQGRKGRALRHVAIALGLWLWSAAARAESLPSTIPGFIGSPAGVLDVTTFGAIADATVARITHMSGAVLTLSIDAPPTAINGIPTHVAIPGGGPTCTTDGIKPPTGLTATPSVMYSGISSSADTVYRYQVTAVGPNGCETTAAAPVQILDGDATLGDGTLVTLRWKNIGSVAYDRVYGCRGASCAPHYIGFATSDSFADFGGSYNSAYNAIRAHGAGPYSRDSGIAPPHSATHDTLFTTIVSGGGTRTLTLKSAPSTSATLPLVLEYDNTTPINNCLAAQANQGVCWVPPGSYPIAGLIKETRSARLLGIAPSSTNSNWMGGGSQLIWQGGYDAGLIFFALDTTRGGIRGLGLDARHFYSGAIPQPTAAMTAINVDGDEAGQHGQDGYGNAFYSTFEDVQTSGAWTGLQIGGAFCSPSPIVPSCDTSLANFKNLTFSKSPIGSYGIVLEADTGANMSEFNHVVCTQWVGAGECIQQYLSGAIPDEFAFVGNTLEANSTTFDLHSGAIRIVNSEDEGTAPSYSLVWRGAQRVDGTTVRLDDDAFGFAEVIEPLQIRGIDPVLDSHDTYNTEIGITPGCSHGVCRGCVINSPVSVLSEGDACYGGWVKTATGTKAQLLKQAGMQDTSIALGSNLLSVNLFDSLQIVPDNTSLGPAEFLINNAGNKAYNWMIAANQNIANCLELTPSTDLNEMPAPGNFTRPALKVCPNGKVSPTHLAIGSDESVSSMARTSLAFDTGHLSSLVANESMGTRFVPKASAVEKITLDVKESPTCSVASAISCYDCGPAPGPCTSGQTSTLGTIAVANGAPRLSSDVAIATTSIPAGDYVSCLIIAGVCSSFDTGIDIELRPQ